MPLPPHSEKPKRNIVGATIYFHLVKTRRERNTHHEDHAGTLIQRFPTPFLPNLLLSRGDHCRHKGYHRLQIPGQLFDDLGKLRSRVYPSSTLGWEAMISLLLSSPTCSAKASFATPLVAAIKLSKLTAGGLARSISTADHLFSGRFEGPAVKT